MSMSVPDEGQSRGVIACDPHTRVVRVGLRMTIRKNVIGTYRRIEFKRKEYVVELEDVISAELFVTSGVMFWPRVMQAVHKKIMIQVTKEQEDTLTDERNEIPIVSVRKNCNQGQK